MNKLIDYGFRPPKIDATHYVSGDGRLLGAAPLNPEGDWSYVLPAYEAQADLFESYGCTIWGLHNQVECMHKYLYAEEPNYDERYNYNLAKIVPPGADPQDSYESARKYGFIQGMLPLPETLKELATPRPMEDKYIEEGKKWLGQYFFDHDWVLTGEPNPERLRMELKKCPLGVSVTAWFLEDGVYVDKGQPNTHWCLLYKMDSKYYYIFDTYDHSKKTLPLSHRICYAKRIVLYKKQELETQQIKILKALLIILQKYVVTLKKALGAVGEIIAGTFSHKQD